MSMTKPDHPHTDELAALCAAHDDAADAGVSVEASLAPYVDTDAISYVALQRGLMMVGSTRDRLAERTDNEPAPPPQVFFAASWLDGFHVGVMWAHREHE